jgi:hypothetical protein
MTPSFFGERCAMQERALGQCAVATPGSREPNSAKPYDALPCVGDGDCFAF